MAFPHVSTRSRCAHGCPPAQLWSRDWRSMQQRATTLTPPISSLHTYSPRGPRNRIPQSLWAICREASAFFLFGSQTGHPLRPASAKNVLCVMGARKGFPSVSSGQLQNIGRYSTTAPACLHYALSGRSTADFRVHCRQFGLLPALP